jgi:hypothetical protein
VHLVWPPLGIDTFSNFISSYCKYNSGYPHELVLLFNGIQTQKELSPYLKIADDKKVKYSILAHAQPAQDLDAYFWAAEQLNTKHLLFVNSYTEFMYDNWLSKYMQHSMFDDIGLIGATGSWESYFRSVFIDNNLKWERHKSFQQNFRKYKLLVKSFVYWRFLFPDFPNPHVRTNAFMISRELMRSLKHEPLKNKMAAFKFESGVNGLTVQVMKKGLRPILIDKNGNAYSINEWKHASIFWSSEQENLLISDNQTRKYEFGDDKTRQWLSLHAWGKANQSLTSNSTALHSITN